MPRKRIQSQHGDLAVGRATYRRNANSAASLRQDDHLCWRKLPAESSQAVPLGLTDAQKSCLI